MLCSTSTMTRTGSRPVLTRSGLGDVSQTILRGTAFFRDHVALELAFLPDEHLIISIYEVSAEPDASDGDASAACDRSRDEWIGFRLSWDSRWLMVVR